MELQQLKYFLEVAKTQHITQSAETLHIAQPALSQSIKRLENELNVKLFTQKGRNIVLAEAGKYLQSKIEPMIETLDTIPEQLQIISKTNYQTIHLNVLAASTLITDAIIKFEKNHSDIKFQLRQSNEDDACDIEITTKMFFQATDSETRFSCPEMIYIAVPDNEKYKDITSISLFDLKDENFISLSGSKQFRFICDKFCHQCGMTPHYFFESDSPVAVKNMIASNLGIGFWPEFTWGSIKSKRIKLIEIENLYCSRDIVVTCKNPENENVMKFFRFLNKYLNSF